MVFSPDKASEGVKIEQKSETKIRLFELLSRHQCTFILYPLRIPCQDHSILDSKTYDILSIWDFTRRPERRKILARTLNNI